MAEPLALSARMYQTKVGLSTGANAKPDANSGQIQSRGLVGGR
jgi:hypothetical protein